MLPRGIRCHGTAHARPTPPLAATGDDQWPHEVVPLRHNGDQRQRHQGSAGSQAPSPSRSQPTSRAVEAPTRCWHHGRSRMVREVLPGNRKFAYGEPNMNGSTSTPRTCCADPGLGHHQVQRHHPRVGTISVATYTRNNASRPRNSNRANTYAAESANVIWPTRITAIHERPAEPGVHQACVSTPRRAGRHQNDSGD